jgi:cupin fold WbuC family metalloprotein
MRTKALSPEVLVANEPIVQVSRADVEFLKAGAAQNERKRIRLCAHPGMEDRLHEMLIVHTKEAYVRPHKHLNKTESVHIIEGLVDVIIFDEAGNISEVISMGDYASGHRFYYRMSGPYYHTLLIRSDVLVFHEITNGPFERAETIFAPWAPVETDHRARDLFMEQVARAAERFASL